MLWFVDAFQTKIGIYGFTLLNSGFSFEATNVMFSIMNRIVPRSADPYQRPIMLGGSYSSTENCPVPKEHPLHDPLAIHLIVAGLGKLSSSIGASRCSLNFLACLIF